jgi:putative transposase
MAKYWTGAHTKHRIRIHLVWIPKYRKRVLRGKIAARVKQLLHQACSINKWLLSELCVHENHVHLLIQINPSDSVADVAKRLKGGSSRIIRKEFPEMEEFLWGDSFWADGYFAESVGKVDEEIVQKYIREQQR